jgi:peroxiredoxin
MDAVLIGARMALIAVFAVAAIAKLADMAGSRRALEGFGVPPSFVPPAAFALPLLELGAAALLAVASLAEAGAALATALLLLFIGGIVAALRRGAAPDCHCFGQLHSKPAGRETLARNAALAAVAVFILAAGPGPVISTWFSHTSGVLVALVLVSVVAAFLLYAGVSLWQHHRELTGRGRASEPPVTLEVGQAAPDVDLESHDGKPITLAEVLADDRRAILVFTSASCVPCLELLPELARWREMLQGQLDIHILAAGDAEENRRLASEHQIPVLLDPDGSAAKSFGVEATPSAVEIDPAGRVAAAPSIGAPAIEGLVRAALNRPIHAQRLEVRYVGGGFETPSASTPT